MKAYDMNGIEMQVGDTVFDFVRYHDKDKYMLFRVRSIISNVLITVETESGRYVCQGDPHNYQVRVTNNPCEFKDRLPV